MSEKYFISFIAVAILIIAIFLLIVLIYLYLRLKYLRNLACINILKHQQKIEEPTIFLTAIINQCVCRLFFNYKHKAQTALASLAAGKTKQAAEFLPLPLAQLLLMHTNPRKVYTYVRRYKKNWLTDTKYGVYWQITAHLVHDIKNLKSAVSCYTDKHRCHSRLTKAYFDYVSSYIYLYEGDMLSASQKASAALNFFQKKQYAMETALCHLLLAEIYRISCINNIAETMIDSAIKIYQTQNTPLFLARAIVIKGMLMVHEDRFTEAHNLYEKALKMKITEQLKADIYNQISLLYLAQKNPLASQKYALLSGKIQQALKNSHGLAFSLQLTALAAFDRNHYNKTIKVAQEATKIYKKQQNISAYIECLYLIAESQYKQNKFSVAEKNLRTILSLSKTAKSNFHSANAYSLLGLIYMQKHDLQRAKVLFQQSLYLEQSNQRCEGLAADYANLALIELQTNNNEAATSNWQIALEYARQSGDLELEKIIEKKLQQQNITSLHLS